VPGFTAPGAPPTKSFNAELTTDFSLSLCPATVVAPMWAASAQPAHQRYAVRQRQQWAKFRYLLAGLWWGAVSAPQQWAEAVEIWAGRTTAGIPGAGRCRPKNLQPPSPAQAGSGRHRPGLRSHDTQGRRSATSRVEPREGRRHHSLCPPISSPRTPARCLCRPSPVLVLHPEPPASEPRSPQNIYIVALGDAIQLIFLL
jgi:hypothetical protein